MKENGFGNHKAHFKPNEEGMAVRLGRFHYLRLKTVGAI